MYIYIYIHIYIYIYIYSLNNLSVPSWAFKRSGWPTLRQNRAALDAVRLLLLPFAAGGSQTTSVLLATSAGTPLPTSGVGLCSDTGCATCAGTPLPSSGVGH